MGSSHTKVIKNFYFSLKDWFYDHFLLSISITLETLKTRVNASDNEHYIFLLKIQ